MLALSTGPRCHPCGGNTINLLPVQRSSDRKEARVGGRIVHEKDLPSSIDRGIYLSPIARFNSVDSARRDFPDDVWDILSPSILS